jgi:hypothetical protein
MKSFARWMVKDRRMPDNPLEHVSRGNVKLDRRHDRRPLSLDEIRLLIETARQSAWVFRELAGRDRAMLYAVACVSGFRAEELSELSPTSFDLDGNPPTVTLPATCTKNGRTAVQPLPPDILKELRGFLGERPVNAAVWPGTWWAHGDAAEMLRADLEAAGIPYTVEGPDGPLYCDFHSLRHSFINLLDRTGATLKEAMTLARHSDPKLTMAVYGRAQIHDLGEAVNRLPSLLAGPAPEEVVLLATGTDSVCAGLRSVCAFPEIEGDSARLPETESEREGGKDAGPNPLKLQAIETSEDRLIPTETTTPGRIRTCDLRFRKPPLYPLSYGGKSISKLIYIHDLRQFIWLLGWCVFSK